MQIPYISAEKNTLRLKKIREALYISALTFCA
jgi:hypothetical protein